jgi:hypothetical protein
LLAEGAARHVGVIIGCDLYRSQMADEIPDGNLAGATPCSLDEVLQMKGCRSVTGECRQGRAKHPFVMVQELMSQFRNADLFFRAW